MSITVTQLKAKCLGIVEEVASQKKSIVITRYGKPAARLIPCSQAGNSKLFGRASKTTQVRGSILSTGEVWNADS